MHGTYRLTRRSYLRLAGAAAVGACAVSAEAESLGTKARKNIRLGIFAYIYRTLPLEKATCGAQ
jgi:hypothetical protein